MAKEVDGCVTPAAGPLIAKPTPTEKPFPKEESKMTVAQTGKKAPDFEATAYVPGKGFQNVKLSDYQNRWLVLCFYPGDFTFV
jgi:hypothetical protein